MKIHSCQIADFLCNVLTARLTNYSDTNQKEFRVPYPVRVSEELK